MSIYDTIIANGTVVTPTLTAQMDLAIKDGKIAAIGKDLDSTENVIDATDCYVLPGGIDSHVHLAQPSGDGIVMADDFASGTLAALHGGNTMILSFCFQEKGGSLRQAVNDYHARANDSCYCDVSFHLVVTDPTAQVLGQELPSLVAAGYSSVKIFMTYEGLRLYDDEILSTLDAARSLNATVMVHCENEDAIRFLVEKHQAANKLAPKYHATTRPVAAEREATHRALALAEIVDVPIVIVHVSNEQAIEEIARARARGRNVVGETCPQYLFLTAEDLDGMDWEGAKFICSPPPRDKQAQQACWQALQDGTFDLFSSDHCPFRYDDPAGKLNPKGRTNFKWVPNGIPGVETRLPLLFSEGVMKGRISLEQFVGLTSTNHAKTYGLYPRKGVLQLGSDADIAIWDPRIETVITQQMLHHGADYTPFEGFKVQGWPTTMLLGGNTVIRERRQIEPKCLGNYIARNVG